MITGRRTAIIAVGATVGAFWLFLLVVFTLGEVLPGVTVDAPRSIEVRRGEGLSRLVHRLGEEGVLRFPALLRGLAVLRSDTGRIKAGEYVLHGEETPSRLLTYLVSGKARFVALTVPEGFSLEDIADRLEARGLGDGVEFLRLARDAEFIAALGLAFHPLPPTLEGFLYPETYYLHRGVPPAAILRVMVQEFRKRVEAIVVRDAPSAGMTPYEVMTLASIIEKETGLASERKLISAVFHNRLKAGMRLGSDPTVIYGIEAFDGNLTRAHLRADTQYNTYINRGLPPTPIASPGVESLEAALDPAPVDFLYFVSKGDGSHFFSKDLRTHNKAVWKYQKQRHRRRNRS